MADSNYEPCLLKDNIRLRVFAHDIKNYRYHWHGDEYELSIVLSGCQEFCRGDKNYILNENDVILIPPGMGHASMRLKPNTRALVLHFPASTFKLLSQKGYIYDFKACLCDENNRDDRRFSLLRFYITNILKAAVDGNQFSYISVKANLVLLLVTLFNEFDPEQMNVIDDDDRRRETMRLLLSYIEEHYDEKLSLEDLADYTGYNRTYVSTLFKQMVGINFHEYLMRVRFQRALDDLTNTKMSLTDIALKNGFSDLKTMTARFRAAVGRSPNEYRAMLKTEDIAKGTVREYIDSDDEELNKKLEEYSSIGKI